MQRNLIIHHDDADGICSAAIAYKYLTGLHGKEAVNSQGCKFIAANYQDSFPEKDIQETEGTVYVLDFSYPPEDMARIPHLVWIDHHKTAIEKMAGMEIPGIRDEKVAACELTWKYFFGNRSVPLAVMLVGDRDMWKFAHGDKTRWFNEALAFDDFAPDSLIWTAFLAGDDHRIASVLSDGMLLYESRIKHLKQIAKDYGKHIGIMGIPRVYVMSVNYPGTGDLGQVIKDCGFHIAHCYIHLRDGRIRHSVYSDTHDVSKIAKHFGGGGHTGAAGWVSETLDYQELADVLKEIY